MCSFLKLLILKFVKNVKVNVVMRQHNVCTCFLCEDVCRTAVRHTSSHRKHVHTLCCRITTLTFTFLTNFKISNFNKEI